MRHAAAPLLCALAAAAALAIEPARAAALRYDHQVVVATTSRDFESDVDASLERQVNALGASATNSRRSPAATGQSWTSC